MLLLFSSQAERITNRFRGMTEIVPVSSGRVTTATPAVNAGLHDGPDDRPK